MAAMDTIKERAPSATGLDQAQVSAADAVAVATNLLTSAMNVLRIKRAISPEQFSHLNSFLQKQKSQLGPVIIVNIIFLSGKTIVVVVPTKDHIYYLVRRIERKTGIPWNEQRLIFLGQNLFLGLTVGDYCIPDNATLQLVRALPRPSRMPEVRSNEPRPSRPPERPSSEPRPSRSPKGRSSRPRPSRAP
jgi:hypothetical protein